MYNCKVSDLQALKYNFNALTHDVFDTVEQTEKNVLNLKFSKSVYFVCLDINMCYIPELLLITKWFSLP